MSDWKRGDRVVLVRIGDPDARVAPGDEGTVLTVDRVGTTHVRWDNGSTLGVVEGDEIRTVSTLAQQYADGLRAIAEMIEQNPELTDNFRGLERSGITVHTRDKNSVAAELGSIARIALRHGARVIKDVDDTWHNVELHFGVIKAKVLAYRSEVCERVVVGSREVTEQVPDPTALAAVPTVEVTRTEEITEWVCRPLLAAESAEDSAAVTS